jgi:hypothetical protein
VAPARRSETVAVRGGPTRGGARFQEEAGRQNFHSREVEPVDEGGEDGGDDVVEVRRVFEHPTDRPVGKVM